MKKIIFTSLFLLFYFAQGFCQPSVMYNLIQDGLSIQVWANPETPADFSPASTTLSAGNQVVIKSQLGTGAGITVTSVTGTWDNDLTNVGSDNLDYTIISLTTSPSITFEDGTPILLFSFSIGCDDGEVALMDNLDTNAPNNANNFNNAFEVVFLGLPEIFLSGEMYTGNVAGSEVSCFGGLPVELISFTGHRVENGNKLKWQTASEKDNAGFEVQRSPNGIDWDYLAWVEGKGTVSTFSYYELLDRNPFAGENYYRLKQIDYDGSFEFSSIVNINNSDGEIAIKVLPNPSVRDVVVTIDNPDKKTMKLSLCNSIGQAIWSSNLLREQYFWQKEFTFSETGAYFFNVQIGDEVYTEKILIVNPK